jgi:hypothetical protein
MATSPAPQVRRPAPKPAVIRVPAPRRDFFVYGLTLTVVANSPATGAIQIQADSDFELQKLSFFADIALADQEQATRVLPLVTLQLTDTGTGRQIFNTPISIPAIMGDGQIPFILPTVKTFAPNSSVQVSLANYSAATDYNIHLALIGSKVYHYG